MVSNFGTVGEILVSLELITYPLMLVPTDRCFGEGKHLPLFREENADVRPIPTTGRAQVHFNRTPQGAANWEFQTAHAKTLTIVKTSMVLTFFLTSPLLCMT